MKYKLLKEYPGSPELGFIIDIDSPIMRLKEGEIIFRENIKEDKGEYWKKLEPIMTVEDLKDGSFHSSDDPTIREDVYEGDTIWLADNFQISRIRLEENNYLIGKSYLSNEYPIEPVAPEGKFFINRYNAEHYYKSLQPEFERQEEKLEISLFITYDGIAKYIGDQLGYFIDTDLEINYSNAILNESFKKIPGYIHFYDINNAQQYVAEQVAKKRGIEVGTIVFDAVTKRKIGTQGVKRIEYFKDNNSNPWILIPNASYCYKLNEVLTFEELAKEGGLEIGMKLDMNLLRTYANYLGLEYMFDINPVIVSFIIFSESHLNTSNKDYLKILEANLPIVGLKKLKKEWELKTFYNAV